MSGGPPISQREMHMLAADALADVVEAAFLDLIGQEGVRNRGPGGADDGPPGRRSTICAMSSGLVMRPTPSTGTLAMLFTSLTQGFWWLAL